MIEKKSFTQILTPDEIRMRIKRYCLEQNGADLRDALRLEQRILALCEVLGATEPDGESPINLSDQLLESVGISVFQINPHWIFNDSEISMPEAVV